MRRVLLGSFLVSLAAWSVATWPLPRYVAEGIPIGHRGGTGSPPRYTHPGDHLQLEYHFWIFGDMLRGRTPWFYNLYEFNTGDDEERHTRSEYYFPFSLFHALGSAAGGRAFGYNVSGFLSIWFTALFTWLLVRRYVASPAISGAATLMALLLPYRWHALLGGSPTGFAMAWPPLLFWGLDRAVRDLSVRGGLWAGAAVALAYTSDLHTFFFSVLAAPAWCLAAWAAGGAFAWRKASSWRKLLTALLPVAVAAAGLVIYGKTAADLLSGTHMEGGRALREVMTFSPRRFGFLAWDEHPVSSQVYVGYGMLGLIVLGGCAMGVRLLAGRPRRVRQTVFAGLLLCGGLLIAVLSLGPHGPRGAFLFLAARRWIPKYEMIRQAGKVFCLLPPVLATLSALALAALVPRRVSRHALLAMVCAPVLLVGFEYVRRTDPPICLLADDQPAYRAVAQDAARRANDRPHAVVVTLWPGDSHYASAYQYYCSLYRIRMLNGYSPAVGTDYFERIFLRFQSINQGWLTDEQADELLERGIDYLLVHEDLFPEKVSPFPIGHTLASFLAHPRLNLLQQAGAVWAFRILAQPSEPAFREEAVETRFAARHWVLDRQPFERAAVREAQGDGRERFLALSEPGASVLAGKTDAPPAEGLRWMVRARGQGRISTECLAGDSAIGGGTIELDAPQWTWISVPHTLAGAANAALRLRLESGQADVCSALLTAGRETSLAVGERIVFPAAWFFHAGHSTADLRAVRFRKAFDPTGIVLYGPKLPFDAGVYEMELHHSGDAPEGVELGTIELEQLFAGPLDNGGYRVVAGAPSVQRFALENNLPFNAIFVFSGRADVRVDAVSLRRLE